jgi:ABC-2 type transport system permease protein
MTTTTMTATTTLTSTVASRPARFIDTLASEWVKLTTLRSTYIILGLGVMLSIAMTALVSLAVGSTFDGWPPAERAQFEPILFPMVGNIFLLILYSVFGVLAVSNEYSSGMIRLTLTATPKRGRVLLAKLLLVTGITMVFGLITTLGMFLVGQAVLGAYGMPVVDLGDADARRMVLGLGAVTPLFPIIGFALGVILRSTAGAITTALGILWLPVIFGGLLPIWWQENILSLLPGPAADSFTIAHIVESPTYSDPAVGAALVGGWLLAFIAAAYFKLRRRDA